MLLDIQKVIREKKNDAPKRENKQNKIWGKDLVNGRLTLDENFLSLS